MNTRHRYTESELNWLKINYPLLGSKNCAQLLKTSVNSIRSICSKHGYKVPRETRDKLHSETNLANFKPTIDINKLKYVNDPKSAYILGLLWADGWITNKNSYSIDIKLVTKDFDEIEWIFNSIGTWKKYQYHPKGRQRITHLRASGKSIVDYLISIGYESKSYLSANMVLNTIPENLHRYWWRGYLDGDGHIKKKSYLISFCSGYEQDWSFLPKSFPFKIIKTQTEKGSYSKAILSQKINVIKFGSFLYNNAENDKIFLPRKYHSFLRIMARDKSNRTLEPFRHFA